MMCRNLKIFIENLHEKNLEAKEKLWAQKTQCSPRTQLQCLLVPRMQIPKNVERGVQKTNLKLERKEEVEKLENVEESRTS